MQLHSVRSFSSRQSGSFSHPATQKKKSSKSSRSGDADSNTTASIHSKATTRTIQSSTRTRRVDGKTETVHRQTISNNTQVHHGQNNVKMTFSQQTDSRSETDDDDPSQNTASKTTQTYKRMDIESPDGKDSHTVINSSQESLSAADADAECTFNSDTQPTVSASVSTAPRDFDPFTVGNPSPEEITRRRAMKSADALIIHPDRLLPVLHSDSQRPKEKGWRHWRRRLKETFTSVREKIFDNETVSEYSQRVREKTDTMRDSYDTSQNYHVVQIRGMIDRLNMQTESSKAMAIIQDDFGDFWVEDFLPAFDELLCPLIVRAYLSDDLEFLDTVCVGEAAVFCKNMIEARMTANQMLAPDVLWLHEAELMETKLHNKKPQLIIRAEVQCIDCVYERGTDKVLEGSPSTVATNIFVMVLEPNVDEEYAKVVPLPWQVRSLSTARQRQIV